VTNLAYEDRGSGEPVLFIAGRGGAGRYLQISDAGHLGFLERPEAVNAAILQFFDSVPV
jgi:hypothetical protein